MEKPNTAALLRSIDAAHLTREVLSGVPSRINPEDHIQYLVDYFEYYKDSRHQAVSLMERTWNDPIVKNAIHAALKRSDVSKKTKALLRNTYKDPDNHPLWELLESDEAIEAIYKDIIKNSEEIINDILNYEPAALPTWVMLELRMIVNEPSWLIHETTKDSADNILHNGFLYGTEDIDALSFTTHRKTENYPGYDFAWGPDFFKCGKYGNARLIFTAPHVIAYHFGDMEHQAIFWGSDAENITRVYGDCGDFAVYHPVTDEEYQGENIGEIIEIVERWV